MTSPEVVAGESSLTGTVVRGSSCQHSGRRRGREKVNTSNPTAYTPLVMGAWKANCFVCVKILLTSERFLKLDYKCIIIIGLYPQNFLL